MDFLNACCRILNIQNPCGKGRPSDESHIIEYIEKMETRNRSTSPPNQENNRRRKERNRKTKSRTNQKYISNPNLLLRIGPTA
jgi:hypothetical protein